MDYALDIKTVIVVLAIIGALIYCWRFIRDKMDEQRFHDELAEEAFEKSVLGTLNLPAEAPVSLSIEETFDQAYSPSVANAPAASGIIGRTEAILKKLKAAGLLVGIERKMEHHGEADALLLVSLSNGKKALIVPNIESEAFLARYQGRADYIVMAGQGENAYVCSPIANFITDNIRF